MVFYIEEFDDDEDVEANELGKNDAFDERAAMSNEVQIFYNKKAYLW